MMLLPHLVSEPSLETLAQGAAPMAFLPNFLVEKLFWRLDTNSDWWDHLIMEWWDDQHWIQNFCMQKATFQDLCAWLALALQH